MSIKTSKPSKPHRTQRTVSSSHGVRILTTLLKPLTNQNPAPKTVTPPPLPSPLIHLHRTRTPITANTFTPTPGKHPDLTLQHKTHTYTPSLSHHHHHFHNYLLTSQAEHTLFPSILQHQHTHEFLPILWINLQRAASVVKLIIRQDGLSIRYPILFYSEKKKLSHCYRFPLIASHQKALRHHIHYAVGR